MTRKKDSCRMVWYRILNDTMTHKNLLPTLTTTH
jgi:hypothetical protein